MVVVVFVKVKLEVGATFVEKPNNLAVSPQISTSISILHHIICRRIRVNYFCVKLTTKFWRYY